MSQKCQQETSGTLVGALLEQRTMSARTADAAATRGPGQLNGVG